MVTRAADRLEEAIGAARVVLTQRLGPVDVEVLHSTNNVVVRGAGMIAKVSTDLDSLGREHRWAGQLAALAGSALIPVSEPVAVGPFGVLLLPVLDRITEHTDVERASAVALAHSVWTPGGHVSTLDDRLAPAEELAGSAMVAAAAGSRTAQLLMETIEAGRVDLGSSVDDVAAGVGKQRRGGAEVVILHGEPHAGNCLSHDGKATLIDFEAVCRGPLVWDAAFFPDEAVRDVWPGIDRAFLARTRLIVSAVVATYCWHHVATADDPDGGMRWHAEHHSRIIERAVCRGGGADD